MPVVRNSPCSMSLSFFLSSAGIQTIDSTQALFLPIGASVSLLVMFFFFDSVQVVFTICTAGDLSFLLFIRIGIELKALIPLNIADKN